MLEGGNVIIVPLLVFASVMLFALAFGGQQSVSVGSRLQRHGYGPASDRDKELSLPFSRRVIVPMLRSVGRLAMALTPASMIQGLEGRLALAGNPYRMTSAQFATITLVLGVALPLLFLGAKGVGIGGRFALNDILILVVLFGVGSYLLPNMWLSSRISSRKKQIDRSLPDTLDLVTISVEAGLTLEAALARIVSRQKGPLADEFARALQETSIGKSRSMALRDISKRAGVADLQSVIAAVVQAEEMGSSIGTVLRVQSDAVRIRRRLHAQEMAIQAPVKMLIPLIFLVLPAMFVVLLDPAVIRIIQVFSNL